VSKAKRLVLWLAIFPSIWYFAASSAAATVPSARTTITLSMQFPATKAATTAAFGPIAEERWSPDFRPAFVVPEHPSQVAGAVFRTPDAHVWLLHDFDPSAGFVQYIVTDAQSEIATLTIRVSGSHPASVRMTYDIIPLDASGTAHAQNLSRHAAGIQQHMQRSIGAYLANRADSAPR